MGFYVCDKDGDMCEQLNALHNKWKLIDDTMTARYRELYHLAEQHLSEEWREYFKPENVWKHAIYPIWSGGGE